MIKLISIIRIIAGGAIMAPLFSWGHGSEFLVARLDVQQEVVKLEILVDYGANPLVPDEAAAVEAIKNILQVHTNGKIQKLEDVARLKFDRRTRWDPKMPATFAPPQDGQSHQILAAVWRWWPDADQVTFSVPRGNVHDVLLWTKDEHLLGSQAKWKMLIEGDRSPLITVRKPWTMRWDLIIRIAAVVGVMLAWSAMRLQKKARARKRPTPGRPGAKG